MPSLAMYSLQPPTDEREFEIILFEYGRQIFEGIPSILGNRGQAQHGIDVVITKIDGSQICIQCKDYIKTKVTERDIDEWVMMADNTQLSMCFFSDCDDITS